MLRSLVVAICLAPVTFAQTPEQYAEKFLDQLCPELSMVRLDADEIGVLVAVAEHYRGRQIPPEVRARRDVIVMEADARHSVSVPNAPQLVFLRTVYDHPRFQLAVRQEMLRHGMTGPDAVSLAATLHSRNEVVHTLAPVKAKALLGMSCRDLMSAAYLERKPRRSDWRNAGEVISISVPALDAARRTALVLAINSIGYPTESKNEGMELILLRRTENLPWRVEWHATIDDYIRRIPLWKKELPREYSATADDYEVFDAMLKHLEATRFVPQSCVALINQTYVVLFFDTPNRSEKVPPAFAAAAHDVEERSWAPVFIGDAPQRPIVRFVQRETLDAVHPSNPHGCRTTIRFSLAGYGPDDTAAVVYTMYRSPATGGDERGEGIGLLRWSAEGWTVEREDYRFTVKSVDP